MTLSNVFESERRNLVHYAAQLGSRDPEGAVHEAVVHMLEKQYDKRYAETGKLPPLAYARLLVYWQVRSDQRRLTNRGNIVANGYTATEPYTPDDPPGPESGFEPAVSEDRTDPEQGDIVLDVRRAVAGLPPEEREVVEAVFFDGFTQSEYAEFRGVSTSWVSRVLDKAKAGLRTELRHYALQQND